MYYDSNIDKFRISNLCEFINKGSESLYASNHCPKGACYIFYNDCVVRLGNVYDNVCQNETFLEATGKYILEIISRDYYNEGIKFVISYDITDKELAQDILKYGLKRLEDIRCQMTKQIYDNKDIVRRFEAVVKILNSFTNNIYFDGDIDIEYITELSRNYTTYT